MAKPLNPAQSKEGKDYIKGSGKKTDKMKDSKGFFGFIDGLDQPPSMKGKRPDELVKLITDIKNLKPFFRGKEVEMTPLTNYFYCRYMASWLRNSNIAQQSLDTTKHIAMTKVGSLLDTYVTFCNLIENVYGDEEAFINKLFPLDRVATVGNEPGLLQKQYGLLRASERKQFRKLASEIKIPLVQVQDGKKWGTTVAYYLEQYLKQGVKLSSLDRDIPVVFNTLFEPVFLEGGAYLVGTGRGIMDAEEEGKEGIERWFFNLGPDDESLDRDSDDYRSFEAEEFLLRYLPSSNESGDKSSHYVLEPYDDSPTSLHLLNEYIFAKRVNKSKGKGKEWVNKSEEPIVLTSAGDTFLPPNPNEFKSFQALGNVVESQMAHFATVATSEEKNQPYNTFELIHGGLLGTKNNPGIAVYHANIFYHNLLAQARDPIANFEGVDQNIFAGGRLISIEAYINSPLKVLSYWLLSFRNYVSFSGLDSETNTPRIATPRRLSVEEGIVDEAAKAEMTNSLSKLSIAYYRCMFAMLKNRPFAYPRTMAKAKKDKDKAPREAGEEANPNEFDLQELSTLWSNLLKDVGRMEIAPAVMSSILTYMFAKGTGVIQYPASMNPDASKGGPEWGRESITKWLKFSYAANPTNIDAYVECASAIFAASNMTEYLKVPHAEGINRFIETVHSQGGYHYLIAILSLDESDALPNTVTSTFRPKQPQAYMPPQTRRNPAKQKKKAVEKQEYVVSIEIELPVQIELNEDDNALEQLHSIQSSLEDEGIDEPAFIGTNGKTLDLGWYIFGLEGAIEMLSDVTEIYSKLGIAGRGWLEWGQEELRENYTVDGYSFDDL